MLLQLCNPSSQFVVRSCWPYLAPACMFMRSPLTPNSGRAVAAAKAYSSATRRNVPGSFLHITLCLQPWTAGIGTWPWALAGNGSMPGQPPTHPAATASPHTILFSASFKKLCRSSPLVFAMSLIPLGFCQSSTQACRCGSKMLRSSWRRWAAACCPQKNLTGSPLRSVLRCQIASHPCMPRSYKRHTQRSTHFSALLDASAPHPPTPTHTHPLLLPPLDLR